jgi:hypothetical protein
VSSQTADLVRSARERTVAEGSARIWTATDLRDAMGSPAPMFEAIGVVSFANRNAYLEARASEEQTARVLELVEPLRGRPGMVVPTVEQAREVRHVSLFLDGGLYERSLPDGRWVSAGHDVRPHPLRPLDLLGAVSDEVRGGESVEIRGVLAKEYANAIDRERLAQLDPGLARQLLCRRAHESVAIRVWIDASGRARRVWWAILPPAGSGPVSWFATEFWDFGVKVDLAAPPAELVAAPATIRQIFRDLREMKHARD